jgi:hypothetical protein
MTEEVKKTASGARQHTKSWGGRFYVVPGERKYPSVTTVLGIINKPALVYWAGKVEREYMLEKLDDLFEAVGDRQMSRASFMSMYVSRVGSTLAHKMKSKEATDIGSIVHDRIEWEMRAELGVKGLKEPFIPDQRLAKDGSVEVHPALTAYEAYKKWRADFKVRPKAVEQTLWSHKWGIAGTMDWLGWVGDKLTLADWKSSKAIYLEMRFQVAAYREMLIEMGHAEAPLHGMVIRLPKVEGGEFEPHDIGWEEQQELFFNVRAALKLWKTNELWEQAQKKGASE